MSLNHRRALGSRRLGWLLPILILAFLACERSPEPRRKIRLADQGAAGARGERFTSTLHLEPGARRAIAVLFFENRTGDQRLEWLQRGLTEMLIRSLSQSPSLAVLSAERVIEILQQAGQEASARQPDLNQAALVAREAKVEAVLSGTISRQGDSLRVQVLVHEPSQGRVVQEESVEGKNLDALFAMVDQLTRQVKDDLALSREQQELGRGIADLSTNSLEAWRSYAAGLEFEHKAMIQEALAQYEKAVTADPSFIAAYYKLALYLYSQGERQRGNHYFEKLKALRQKATRKEQYQIDRLEAGVQGNLRKLIDISREWARQNPDDIDANFNLGDLYFGLQQYREALRAYQEILRVDPQYKMAYNQIGYCFARMGQLDSAAVIMQQYQELAPTEPNPFDSMGEIYYNQGEYRLAEKNLRRSLSNNANFAASLLTLSHLYLEEGEYAHALEVIDQYLGKAGDPRSQANGYSQKGLILWRMKRMEEAIASMHKLSGSPDMALRSTMWVYELYLEKGDTLSARNSLLQNYAYILDSLSVSEPKYAFFLAQLALWQEIKPGETLAFFKNLLAKDANPQLQARGRFYLDLLDLKYGHGSLYRSRTDPAAGFIELVREVRELPLARESWKHFLIFNRFARLKAGEGAAIYDRLIGYCREQDWTGPEMLFHLFLADLYAGQKDSSQAAAELAIAGVPDEGRWRVIAPYDNTNGFMKVFPPERRPERITIGRALASQPEWQLARDGCYDGYIDLKAIYPRYNWSVGYACITVHSSDRRRVQLRLGTNDAARLWLNGREVWRMNMGRDAVFDNDIVEVELQPGDNPVLLKICNRINEWGFYFRITDAAGRGIPGLAFTAADRQAGKE